MLARIGAGEEWEEYLHVCSRTVKDESPRRVNKFVQTKLQVMRLGFRCDESVYIDITRYFFMPTTY